MKPRPLPEVLTQLYARATHGIKLDLDRIRAASRELGSPHEVGRYVHIAGTNGKGSVSAMVAEIAKHAGLRVGLYTSPHLCRFAERIQIEGAQLDDARLAGYLERALALSPELTFFELTTLAAFQAFREAQVELSVLEVGLGGRLDATNIVEGSGVQAITRIAFDHMEHLGNTLAKIAMEKAGILRAGQTCVLGRLHPDARESVEQVAASVGARLQEVSPADEERILGHTHLKLLGGYQRHNALVAAGVARELGFSDDLIRKGLSTVTWPGRCELISHSTGAFLLDGAHNPDGAVMLRNVLFGVASSISRPKIALIFGTMADKRWRAMLDRISGELGPKYFVEPKGRKAADAAAMARYAKGTAMPSLPEAIQQARQAVGKEGVIVICGSLYLVGEARAFLLGLPMDPPVAL